MSDLEQAAPRASIITSAVGKLRSMGRNTSQFGETDGLVDAFAEVFAQMSVAAPPTVGPVEPTSEPHDESGEEVSQAAESSDYRESGDSDAPDGKQVAAIQNEQPLVAPQQETELDLDAGLLAREDVTTEVVATESDQGGDQHQEHNADVVEIAETVEVAGVVEVDAQAEDVSDTRHESDLTAESPVAAAVVSDSQRRDRPETNSDRRDEASRSSSRQIDRDPTAKSAATPSDHQHRNEGNEFGDQQNQSESGPAERTTRQQFLDARRTERGGKDSNARQLAETNSARPAESALESADLSEAIRNTPATKASATVRPSSVAQPAVDPINRTTGTASKAAASSATGRTDARAGTQNIQGGDDPRSTRAAKPAPRTAKNDASTTAARVKLVQRVSRAFQHLGPEGGMVRLRLAPAELGSVRVEMQINQRKVQARVVAETEAASNSLREHLPDLRARLESYGMQVERLEIETESNDAKSGLPFDREPGQRDPGQNKSEQRQADRERSADPQKPLDQPADRREVEPTSLRRRLLASQGVDLRV